MQAGKGGKMESTPFFVKGVLMEHPDEITHAAVRMRLDPEQRLWLLWGEDGSYLAAGHAQAGRVLLSWTTRDEMDASVRRLEERAPALFRAHQPVQRSVREAMETAYRLGCRLRIDEYVVEGFHVPTAVDLENE
jgi:hypothetical protein